MKKLFPVRAYFIRARVFGFILIFVAIFYVAYALITLVQK